MTEAITLQISRLAAQGDGAADHEGRPVFVPLTLAGETVTAVVEDERGRLVDVAKPSPDRIAPVCRHFGTCGGCALQHMAAPAYLAWKREQVIEAFRARGIQEPVAAVVPCAGTRRRAVLAARRSASGGVTLGFHKASSHDLINIEECPVLHPSILAALPALNVLVNLLLSRRSEVRITATWTDAGLDVALADVTAELTPKLRAEIAKATYAGRFARVSIAGDPIFESAAPYLRMGRAEVVPPPGSFLQAVAEAEAIMADKIVAALGKAKRVADLFSGVGAFTFRIAEKARVFAADNDKAAILALLAATKKATGLKPIDARARDLFREPLSATELNDFDAVVFDPPRAGADAQTKMIAKSKLKTVVSVSCNPATLARDARTLIDGGYKIESITPVDQFHYSPHIEVVAVFRK